MTDEKQHLVGVGITLISNLILAAVVGGVGVLWMTMLGGIGAQASMVANVENLTVLVHEVQKNQREIKTDVDGLKPIVADHTDQLRDFRRNK